MPSYKDEPSLRESGSFDNVEMQEGEGNYSGEQEERLLSGGDFEATGDITYKVEWHLRTGWAVAGSLLVTAFMFLGLVFFTKLFIVSDNANDDPSEISGIGSFRRRASDYILDPAWNFNAAKQVRAYKWTITDIVGNPDGVFKPLLTINGQFPGPMIECNEGDTLVIEVDNQSVNATSLHFHGIF